MYGLREEAERYVSRDENGNIWWWNFPPHIELGYWNETKGEEVKNGEGAMDSESTGDTEATE